MTERTDPRLGTDYILGTFFGTDRKPHAVRLTAAPARTDANGMAALQDVIAGTGVKKFMLVPVPEHGDALPELVRQIETLQSYRASRPKCAVCGAGYIDICPACGNQ